MIFGLLIRTIIHLRPQQILYQLRKKVYKPKYKAFDSSFFIKRNHEFKTAPIAKYTSLKGNVFSFLNLDHEFAGWNFTENGMLWAYNQNYFDWINQEGFSEEEGCKWIDRFIKELPENKVGLDPYPIALRSINWVKFFCRYPESATKARLDSLYSQIKLLEKKLEYHLLGNHLLEDAYALYIVASFFGDNKLMMKARKLLKAQLKEQILPDGAHYEQSPMYHCILFDRLLDCININTSSALEMYASKMLGHLESIVWNDRTIPMLNDSAHGIAPEPNQLFDYAKRLGLKWRVIPLKESGYRKLQNEHFEAFVDVGNITASYQPGHSHADTLNFELRVDGNPVILDTGISTYNATSRRQYERSTEAHNCVVVDGKDSSEVWGGFRVGRRCNVRVINDNDNTVVAEHDGYKQTCLREFKLEENAFTVIDKVDSQAVSYVHLAPGIDANKVKVIGADRVELLNEKASMAYNTFVDIKVMKITFTYTCKYIIEI